MMLRGVCYRASLSLYKRLMMLRPALQEADDIAANSRARG
jgi:hypothetical protein